MTGKGLTPEQIREILGNRRTKGLYEDCLVKLTTESDEAAVNVVEAWPVHFKNRNANTLYQGFTNAAKKLKIADDLEIINSDGQVFIMVKDRVSIVLDDSDTPENDEAPAPSDADVPELVEA